MLTRLLQESKNAWTSICWWTNPFDLPMNHVLIYGLLWRKNKNFPKSPLFLAPKRDKKGDALSPIYPFLLTLPLYFLLTQFLRASLSSLRFCIKQRNRLLQPYHPTRSGYLFPPKTLTLYFSAHWNIMQHESTALLSDVQEECVLYDKITEPSLIVSKGKKSTSRNGKGHLYA